MEIFITRDEKGQMSSIKAKSESSDGHLSDSEVKLISDFLNKESEEKTKEAIGKHKEWANASNNIIKSICSSLVEYYDEKEIRDAAKQPEFDHSVDHIDFSKSALPQNEEKPKDQKYVKGPYAVKQMMDEFLEKHY